MRHLWHRLLVALGLRKPFVLTPEMIVNIALQNLDSGVVRNNALIRRMKAGRHG